MPPKDAIPPSADQAPSGRGGGESTDRAATRNRRAAVTGGTAVLARAVQVGTSLITVPLTIHYLGNERFGLWMAISSVLAMANFADFGLGNGVLNTVAEAYGKDDIHGVRRAISSGFAVLSAVAVLLFAGFLILYPLISWADAFRVRSELARAEASPALLVFAFCFVLNIPLDLVQRAQLGLQQGFRTNLWQLCGSMAGLAGVIAGIRLHRGLPLLVAALAGGPVLATALNTLQFFAVGRPDLRPRWQMVSREGIHQIGRLGGLFFLLQIVVAVSFSADNFIVARLLGAASVPDYSIPQRMFALISMMVAMLVTPLWPAYGEAISRGDTPWVRRTLVRSLWAILALASAASLVLLLLGPRLILWWVGPQVHPTALLLVGLALWTVMDCCGNTLAMFLNGAGIMRAQIAIASIFGVACLVAKVYLTHRFGVAAVPWATLLTYLSLVAIPYAIYVPRAMRQLHRAPTQVLVATPVMEE